MQRLSRYLTIFVAGTLMIPAVALAKEDAIPRVKAADFCARFSDTAGKVGDATATGMTKFKDGSKQRTAKVDSDFAVIQQKIAASRTASDGRLKDNFAGLDAKATTDAGKQAVTVYKASLIQALATRRSAVDAANQAYKAGLLTTLNSQQTQLQAAATAYQAAIAAAVAQARASCTAGTSPATVRQALVNSLGVAAQTLQTARASTTKARPNLEPLKAARNAAIAGANADFKAAAAAALATLKSSL